MMKRHIDNRTPWLRMLLLAGFALVMAACNRKVTAEDFQIVVVSIENTASWANLELRVDGPQKAGDFQAVWSAGIDTVQGTSVTFAKQDDFEVQVVITPENGPNSITLNAQIDLRARLLAGGDGITDYRSEFLGVYNGTFRHDHYDDLNGTVTMETGESRITVTKADASQPPNYLQLEYRNPTQTTQAAVNAVGDGNFGYYNYLSFRPEVDSLQMTVMTGGLSSSEHYYHLAKR